MIKPIYDSYNLFEKTYRIKSMDNRKDIKLEVRARDHEDIVHVHFTYKDKDYRYFVEGDYFLDHISKPCKLNRNISDAVSQFCQTYKEEITNQYKLGKGSHENNRRNKPMQKNARKPKNRQTESLKLSTKTRYADNVFYEWVPWIVKEVTPQNDYTLLLQFRDGKRGVYDMWPLIQQEDGGDDTFVSLEDINLFMKAYKDGDSVAWNDDIDIAPEELYANCMSTEEYMQWSAEDDDENHED